MLTSTVPTANKAYATYVDPITSITNTTPVDSVAQKPIVFTPAALRYTKTVRNVTTNSNGGTFVEADTIADGVLVNT